MTCELCNQKPAIYNVQVRPLQEGKPGRMAVGIAGTPSMGDVLMNVRVCEKCLPFEKVKELEVERRVVVKVRV